MNFTGIDTTILMQAGAALGALVVVFYILKLKRRPIAVPFGPLWQRILRDKEATSWFQHLKRLLSLLLQLAVLAALLLALGDPRPTITADEGRHVVVLIDASAPRSLLPRKALNRAARRPRRATRPPKATRRRSRGPASTRAKRPSAK